MLSADDVRRIAAEEDLGEHADELLRCVRPGWRLQPVPGAVPAGSSKFGGAPDMATNEAWPINSRGARMTFLAQIAFDELPAVDAPWVERVPALAPGGLLRIFADIYENPYDPGPARAMLAVGPTRLTATEPPEMPEPDGARRRGSGDGEAVHALPETRVQAVPFLTAPEHIPGISDGWTTDGVYAWANRLKVDGAVYDDEELDEDEDEGYPDDAPMPWEMHHFLGEASAIQDDVRSYPAGDFDQGGGAAAMGCERDRELARPDAWTTLLAIRDDPSVEGLSILDAGAYTVLIPATDLAAGVFDRCYCAVDSA